MPDTHAMIEIEVSYSETATYRMVVLLPADATTEQINDLVHDLDLSLDGQHQTSRDVRIDDWEQL